MSTTHCVSPAASPSTAPPKSTSSMVATPAKSRTASATATATRSCIATTSPRSAATMTPLPKEPKPMTDSVRDLALQCKQAAVAVAELGTQEKNDLLHAMADALEAGRDTVLAANAEDMAAARDKGVGDAMLDRLALDETRLKGIADALRFVASLPDPVGQVTDSQTSDKGFTIERVRVPLGVVSMIYEARPNVTADAAALCLKAGNGVILRGGSNAVRSNTAIAACLHRALVDAGLPEHAVVLMEDLSREAMLELMQLSDIVDLIIPRGGEGLIRFVTENARVPVIKHYKGVCHLYVDKAADLDKAVDL